jgi:lycopene beta-cyclase
MVKDYDLLIIGAGCAGLSLGAQLARMNQVAPKTLLLEKRKVYENDRTWCFWGEQNCLYSDLADTRWSQVLVQCGDERHSLDCSSSPYHHLSSDVFYTNAIRSIQQNPLVELKTDQAISKEPEFKLGWWHIDTSFGPARAKCIVDTRPKSHAELGNTTLWQSFVGYEIESERDSFDPTTAMLMDFYEGSAEFVGFKYVLPKTTKRALIEFTVFAERPYSSSELLARLEEAIAAHLGNTDFVILRKESGVIPMGVDTLHSAPTSRQSHPTYAYAGLSAGAARAATGYAFSRIQNWASECARSLVKTGLPTTHVGDSYIQRTMDDIFLKALRLDPRLGPVLFMNLFAKVDNKRLIRFLSDRGGFFDYLAVIKALPAAPLLRSLLKRATH